MSTTAPTKDLAGPAQEAGIKIYSHSPILYWWPVWAVCFVMALWTYADNHHAAFVPEHTVVEGNRIIAPEGTELDAPLVHVARSRWPGVVFVFALLFAVYVSNASLRGPWALFGLASLAALILLFNWLDWWSPVYRWLGLMRLHLNLGAYLAVGVPLFLMWVVTVCLFDRRTYVVFTTGQVHVRDELGEAEKVYDTGSVSLEKEPYDWLRYLVGFGAGDLLLRVGGPQAQLYSLPNVVGVGAKMMRVEERLRTRDVV